MVGSWQDRPRTAGSSYSDGVLHRYFFRVALDVSCANLHPRVARAPCIVLVFVLECPGLPCMFPIAFCMVRLV